MSAKANLLRPQVPPLLKTHNAEAQPKDGPRFGSISLSVPGGSCLLPSGTLCQLFSAKDEEEGEGEEHAGGHKRQGNGEFGPSADCQWANDAQGEEDYNDCEHDREWGCPAQLVSRRLVCELVHRFAVGVANEEKRANKAQDERDDKHKHDQRPVGGSSDGLECRHARDATEHDRGRRASKACERLAPCNARVAYCGWVLLRHQKIYRGDGVVQGETEEQHEANAEQELVGRDEDGADDDHSGAENPCS